MTFNDFAKTALSNEVICIVDDVTDVKMEIIEEPRAAYRWIDSCYADRDIDRFTMIPRPDNAKFHMLAVSFK